ncbi:MAG: sulfatase-like hydrolase/transferase [Caldilineaceae bacterium]
MIFLSDHGDYCGDHGLYLKGIPAFREAYHVPCIMRWPKGIQQPNREVNAFVSLADFAPTFLSWPGSMIRTTAPEKSGTLLAR